jgi:hypothetical protein
MSNLVKCFLCIYWDDQVVFVFASVNVLNYIYWFAYVEQPLYLWAEANLIMVNDLSDMLCDLVCHYFYWAFLHQCLIRRLACSSPFWCVLGWYCDDCITGIVELVRQCSLPFYFMENFKECWFWFFFKGMVEFSRESVRSCSFLF